MMIAEKGTSRGNIGGTFFTNLLSNKRNTGVISETCLAYPA